MQHLRGDLEDNLQVCSKLTVNKITSFKMYADKFHGLKFDIIFKSQAQARY